MKRRIIVSLLILLASALGLAQSEDPNNYDRLLLPVMLRYPVSGAYGSVWATPLWVWNSGQENVPFVQGNGTCGVEGCSGPPVLPAGELYQWGLTYYGDASNPGVFVSVWKEKEDSVQLQLRITDLSRQELNFGTELPVVRRSGIPESAPVHLLGIPTRDPFRATLRVYDLEDPGSSRVLVRIFRVPEEQGDTGDATPFLEFPLDLHYVPGEASPFPVHPGFAQVTSISDSFPAVLNYEHIAIEVKPLDPGRRIWAFVSITNNETQHVTLVTPK
ncbi:MAG: hypothetical protein WBX15_18860 [Thermoanaerobaculia bacterium]